MMIIIILITVSNYKPYWSFSNYKPYLTVSNRVWFPCRTRARRRHGGPGSTWEPSAFTSLAGTTDTRWNDWLIDWLIDLLIDCLVSLRNVCICPDRGARMDKTHLKKAFLQSGCLTHLKRSFSKTYNVLNTNDFRVLNPITWNRKTSSVNVTSRLKLVYVCQTG